jgi:hypothetical protein
MAGINKTVFTNASDPQELRAPRDGRTYLLLQNNSDADIYYDEGTIPDANTGIKIGAGQYLELNQSQGRAVPQGNLWIVGASASPTRQAVRVKEG